MGVSAVAVFFSAGADGFFNKPLTGGRLLGGLGTRVFEAGLGTRISGAYFSGLGLRVRGTEMVLGGGIPYMDVRGCLNDGVFAEGVWNDWMLLLLRSGLSSTGESGLLKVAIWERKVETDSSKPEAEPGLLPVERPPDSSD